MDQAAQQKAYAKVVAKAWADEGFKRRLLAEPTQVLKEHGIETPAGMQVRVVENTEQLAHFVLPPAPAPGEMGTVDLEERLAAAAYSYCATMLCN